MNAATIQDVLCSTGLTWRKTLILTLVGVLAGLALVLTFHLPVS